MTISRLITLACCSLLVFLTACTHQTHTENNAVQWGFDGKFALRSPQQNQSGYIQWQQYEHRFEAKVWGVLGFGTTYIRGDGKRIEVDNGKQQLTLPYDQPVEIYPHVFIPVGDIAQNAPRILLNATDMQPYFFGPNNQWQARTLQSISYDKLSRPTKIHVKSADTTLKILMKRWF